MYTTLEKFGIVCLALWGFRIGRSLLRLLYNSVLAPSLKLGADLKGLGEWAVITGATDGLGKAFAEKLAKHGINIVLISRSKTKLDDVAADIEEKYKVKTKVIEADFTDGNKVFSHIEKELYELEIGVLINNVGLSYDHPEFFLDVHEKERMYNDIIQCNIMTTLAMCQIVMPGMVEQKKGLIINVASTTATIPSPFLSVYGASKMFVSKFSKDLAIEYKRFGIIVQCLLPGFVATNMSKIKKSTWMAPSPQKYVEHALKTAGIEDHTTGYYPHSLLVGCLNLMESITPRFSEWMIVRSMESLRSRALRRANGTVD